MDTKNVEKCMRLFGSATLYYAVERNSLGALQLLIDSGVNPKVFDKALKIPVLTFAILHGRRTSMNTTEVVRLLLAHGADPNVIPSDMWTNYVETPKPTGPIFVTGPAEWCTADIRKDLADALHLTHRYSLYRASRQPTRKKRELQIAGLNNMTELFKAPYFLIGQSAPLKLVMIRVFTHISHQTKRPLVMAFAGPSDHGKTELAIKLGELLQVNHQLIDCTHMQTTTDLLGSSCTYNKSEKGFVLNNFIAANDGKRAVMFLDEFDKTSKEVLNSLLIAVDKGTIMDRRNNNPIDCSKFIWIVATNYGDKIIEDFHEKNLAKLDDNARENVALEPLQNDLLKAFRSRFGAPFTGRLRLIVPFLPFTRPEQAVVLHKFFLEYADERRLPINLDPEVRHTINHIDLELINNGKFCANQAKRYFSSELGARSLINAVETVKDNLTKDYADTDELVEEKTNEGVLQKYVVRLLDDRNGGGLIGVFRDNTVRDGEVTGDSSPIVID